VAWCPEDHVLVIIRLIIVRVGEARLLVGVIPIRIFLLVLLLIIILIVLVLVVFIIVIVTIEIIVVLVQYGLFLLLLEFSLLLRLGSEATDVVLLDEGIVDGELGQKDWVSLPDPVLLTRETAGEFVKLRGVLCQVLGVGSQVLWPCKQWSIWWLRRRGRSRRGVDGG